ncbi:hypothetical protein N0V84_002426 [Fusarium piperis]|uniref:Uncharacterized protein n=1 Tax=Fusarium piperis TaxID=1435070 RepID=A0A9W8WJ94_9HYPO|nr:hypothetical protein N0V84_002426 [Fusarium piperis]
MSTSASPRQDVPDPEMYYWPGGEVVEPELTYVNWIFLAAIYGTGHGRLKKFHQPLKSKYGWDLSSDLAFYSDVYESTKEQRELERWGPRCPECNMPYNWP